MKKIFLFLLSSFILTATFGQTPIRYAPISSPHLTGTPLAPTPSTADNSTKLATTAYVQSNFTANSIFFGSGTFLGAGTSVSPYTLGFLSNNNILTGLSTYKDSTIVTTYNPLMRFANNQASTASSDLWSPSFETLTHYNSAGVDHTLAFLWRSESNSSTTVRQLLLQTSLDGATPVTVASFDNFQDLNLSGTLTLSKLGFGATSTDGQVLYNASNSSAGTTLQKSSRTRWEGSVWNTTATAAPNYMSASQEVGGVSGLIPTGTFDTYTYIGTSTTPTFVKSTSLDMASGNFSLLTGELIPHGTLNAINATATTTATQLAGGVITSTSASATSITLPTATLMATQIGAARGTSFEFTIDNTLGANTVTIILGSGMTQLTAITGANTLTIASGTAGVGVFRLYFASTTACTISRIE